MKIGKGWRMTVANPEEEEDKIEESFDETSK